MNFWISVKEKNPCSFYSLMLDDDSTKYVIVEAINDKTGEDEHFRSSMNRLGTGWKFEDETEDCRIICWTPQRIHLGVFLSECKERYPEFYKQHFEEGGSDE